MKRRSSRLPAVATAAIAVSLIVCYVVLWLTVVSPERERGSDFSASYVAAQMLRDGDAAHMYDPAIAHARHATLLSPGTTFDLPFLTPPTTAALTVPLTYLDPGVAFRIFSLLQLILVAGACTIVARAAPWQADTPRVTVVAATLAGIAGAASAVLLLLGQWDGVNCIGIAVAYSSWRRGKGGRAAAALAVTAMLAKPHLAVGLAAYIAGRRYPRELAAAAAATLICATAWVGIAGTDGINGMVDAARHTLDHNPPLSSTKGIGGLLASWLGDSSAVQTAGLMLGAVLLGVCAWLGHRSREGLAVLEPTLAAAVALSLLAAPHVLAHDLAVLAAVVVMAVARFTSLTRVMAGWFGINVLIAADAGGGGTGPPGRLAPWALMACAAAAIWALRTRLHDPV